MFKVVDLLTRAARISWQSKGLWLAGILVAVLGVSSEFDVLAQVVTLDPGTFLGQLWATLDRAALLTPAGLGNAAALLQQSPQSFFLSAGILLALTAAVVAVTAAAVMSEGLLVANAAARDANRPLPIRKLWQVSRRQFWRLVVITVVFTVGFGVLVNLLSLLLTAPEWVFAITFTLVSILVVGGTMLFKLMVCLTVLVGSSLQASLTRVLAMWREHLLGLLRLVGALELIRLAALILYRSTLEILDPPLAALIASAARSGGNEFGLFVYDLTLLAGVALSTIVAGGLLAFQWSAWGLAVTEMVRGRRS